MFWLFPGCFPVMRSLGHVLTAGQPNPPRNPRNLCWVYFGLFGAYLGLISALFRSYFGLFRPYFGLISAYFGLTSAVFRLCSGPTHAQNPTMCFCRSETLSLSSETTSRKISLIKPYFHVISSSPCPAQISINKAYLCFFLFLFVFVLIFWLGGFGRGGGSWFL